METTDKELKRPPTRSIYLLNYDNACKVIDFIRLKDTGALDSDYASISPGKVHTQVNDENWQAVVNFLNSLDVRYEVFDANDKNCVAKSLGSRIVDKENNLRRPDMPIYKTVTEEQLNSIIEGCKLFHEWLKTQRARDLFSNKNRKDMFIENNHMIKRCKEMIGSLKQKEETTV